MRWTTQWLSRPSRSGTATMPWTRTIHACGTSVYSNTWSVSLCHRSHTLIGVLALSLNPVALQGFPYLFEKWSLILPNPDAQNYQVGNWMSCKITHTIDQKSFINHIVQGISSQFIVYSIIFSIHIYYSNTLISLIKKWRILSPEKGKILLYFFWCWGIGSIQCPQNGLKSLSYASVC